MIREVCDTASGLHVEFAQQHLQARQIDAVDVEAVIESTSPPQAAS